MKITNIQISIGDVIERVNELKINNCFFIADGEVIIYKFSDDEYELNFHGDNFKYINKIIKKGKFDGYWDANGSYYLKKREFVRFVEGIRKVIENMVFM